MGRKRKEGTTTAPAKVKLSYRDAAIKSVQHATKRVERLGKQIARLPEGVQLGEGDDKMSVAEGLAGVVQMFTNLVATIRLVPDDWKPERLNKGKGRPRVEYAPDDVVQIREKQAKTYAALFAFGTQLVVLEVCENLIKVAPFDAAAGKHDASKATFVPRRVLQPVLEE